MDTATRIDQQLGEALAARAPALTRRWLEQLNARRAEPPERVFPAASLLDHIPEVLRFIAEYIGASGASAHAERARQSLRQLGRLRAEQGYEVEDIQDEFEILGGLIFDELERVGGRSLGEVDAASSFEIGKRLYTALLLVSRVTAEAFRDAAQDNRRAYTRMLGEYARSVGHELRNRLQAVDAIVQVLQEEAPDWPGSDDQDSEMQGRALTALRRSVESLGDLAEDLRSLAVVQGSDAAVSGRVEPLSRVIETVLEQLVPLAHERGVEVHVTGDLPTCPVDASRAELVLVNLVGNAIKYCDPRKPSCWVDVAAEMGTTGCVVRVADNGRGIPAEHQKTIFEWHTRGGHTGEEPVDSQDGPQREGGDGERAGGGPGSGDGIGLAIAREAVQQLGGELTVESVPGDGSTFSFTLPPVRHDLDPS